MLEVQDFHYSDERNVKVQSTLLGKGHHTG